MNLDMTVPGYESLRSVLLRAYDQAARTKGAERHANDLPFHEQRMQTIAAKRGVGFLFGQVDKKTEEAQGMYDRGETAKAIHEMLGAINYLAGAIIFMEAGKDKVPAKAEPNVAETIMEAGNDKVTAKADPDEAIETIVISLQEAEGCGNPNCSSCYPESGEVNSEALPAEVQAMLDTIKAQFGKNADIRVVRL